MDNSKNSVTHLVLAFGAGAIFVALLVTLGAKITGLTVGGAVVAFPTDVPAPPPTQIVLVVTATPPPQQPTAQTTALVQKATATSLPVSTLAKPMDYPFRFKVDGKEATTGELRVTTGRHTVEIGSPISFYYKPYLMFDGNVPFHGWTFFQTKVGGSESIVLCVPVDGLFKMGDGIEGVGADLRKEFSCP